MAYRRQSPMEEYTNPPASGSQYGIASTSYIGLKSHLNASAPVFKPSSGRGMISSNGAASSSFFASSNEHLHQHGSSAMNSINRSEPPPRLGLNPNASPFNASRRPSLSPGALAPPFFHSPPSGTPSPGHSSYGSSQGISQHSPFTGSSPLPAAWSSMSSSIAARGGRRGPPVNKPFKMNGHNSKPSVSLTPAALSALLASERPKKRAVVKLPREGDGLSDDGESVEQDSIEEQNEEASQEQLAARNEERRRLRLLRRRWRSRSPLKGVDVTEAGPSVPFDCVASSQVYPDPKDYEKGLPDFIDIYLPVQEAWQDVKEHHMQERLARMVREGQYASVDKPNDSYENPYLTSKKAVYDEQSLPIAIERTIFASASNSDKGKAMDKTSTDVLSSSFPPSDHSHNNMSLELPSAGHPFGPSALSAMGLNQEIEQDRSSSDSEIDINSSPALGERPKMERGSSDHTYTHTTKEQEEKVESLLKELGRGFEYDIDAEAKKQDEQGVEARHGEEKLPEEEEASYWQVQESGQSVEEALVEKSNEHPDEHLIEKEGEDTLPIEDSSTDLIEEQVGIAMADNVEGQGDIAITDVIEDRNAMTDSTGEQVESTTTDFVEEQVETAVAEGVEEQGTVTNAVDEQAESTTVDVGGDQVEDAVADVGEDHVQNASIYVEEEQAEIAFTENVAEQDEGADVVAEQVKDATADFVEEQVEGATTENVEVQDDEADITLEQGKETDIVKEQVKDPMADTEEDQVGNPVPDVVEEQADATVDGIEQHVEAAMVDGNTIDSIALSDEFANPFLDEEEKQKLREQQQVEESVPMDNFEAEAKVDEAGLPENEDELTAEDFASSSVIADKGHNEEPETKQQDEQGVDAPHGEEEAIGAEEEASYWRNEGGESGQDTLEAATDIDNEPLDMTVNEDQGEDTLPIEDSTTTSIVEEQVESATTDPSGEKVEGITTEQVEGTDSEAIEEQVEGAMADVVEEHVESRAVAGLGEELVDAASSDVAEEQVTDAVECLQSEGATTDVVEEQVEATLTDATEEQVQGAVTDAVEEQTEGETMNVVEAQVEEVVAPSDESANPFLDEEEEKQKQEEEQQAEAGVPADTAEEQVEIEDHVLGIEEEIDSPLHTGTGETFASSSIHADEVEPPVRRYSIAPRGPLDQDLIIMPRGPLDDDQILMDDGQYSQPSNFYSMPMQEATQLHADAPVFEPRDLESFHQDRVPTPYVESSSGYDQSQSLNAAAPAFTPSNFTFTAPSDAPRLPSLEQVEGEEVSEEDMQGRQKRQRHHDEAETEAGAEDPTTLSPIIAALEEGSLRSDVAEIHLPVLDDHVVEPEVNESSPATDLQPQAPQETFIMQPTAEPFHPSYPSSTSISASAALDSNEPMPIHQAMGSPEQLIKSISMRRSSSGRSWRGRRTPLESIWQQGDAPAMTSRQNSSSSRLREIIQSNNDDAPSTAERDDDNDTISDIIDEIGDRMDMALEGWAEKILDEVAIMGQIQPVSKLDHSEKQSLVDMIAGEIQNIIGLHYRSLTDSINEVSFQQNSMAASDTTLANTPRRAALTQKGGDVDFDFVQEALDAKMADLQQRIGVAFEAAIPRLVQSISQPDTSMVDAAILDDIHKRLEMISVDREENRSAQLDISTVDQVVSLLIERLQPAVLAVSADSTRLHKEELTEVLDPLLEDHLNRSQVKAQAHRQDDAHYYSELVKEVMDRRMTDWQQGLERLGESSRNQFQSVLEGTIIPHLEESKNNQLSSNVIAAQVAEVLYPVLSDLKSRDESAGDRLTMGDVKQAVTEAMQQEEASGSRAVSVFGQP